MALLALAAAPVSAAAPPGFVGFLLTRGEGLVAGGLVLPAGAIRGIVVDEDGKTGLVYYDLFDAAGEPAGFGKERFLIHPPEGASGGPVGHALDMILEALP